MTVSVDNIIQMGKETPFLLRLQVNHYDNGTFSITLKEPSDYNISHSGSQSGSYSGSHNGSGYDDTGALYYVIVVVFIYGFSIILMIGSSIKKDSQDGGVSKYMKDLDKVKRLERRQEKFKVRLMMCKSKYHHILGSDRADIILNDEMSSDISGYYRESSYSDMGDPDSFVMNMYTDDPAFVQAAISSTSTNNDKCKIENEINPEKGGLLQGCYPESLDPVKHPGKAAGYSKNKRSYSLAGSALRCVPEEIEENFGV